MKKIKEIIKMYFKVLKKAFDPDYMKEYAELVNKRNEIEKQHINEKYEHLINKNSENKKQDFAKEKINENKLYYKKKRYITTKNELNVYKELLKICKKYNLILLTQVALYEIVEVNLNKNDKKYLKYFNKIKSKTIDFVIIDEETTRIRLCIELDDKTHYYKNRIERDNFINSLFKDLDIELLRIKSSYNYNKEEIERIIKNTCTDIIYKE